MRPWVSPKNSASSRARADLGLQRGDGGGEVHLRPNQAGGLAGDLLGDATLGQGHGQPAFAAIVGALDHPGADQRAQRQVQVLLALEVGSAAARRSSGRG